MAGIYVHVPFCASRCIYCDFYSQTNIQLKKDFLFSLCREIELLKELLGQTEIIRTVYFGGGTPSLLSVAELASVTEQFRKYFPIVSDAEWTLEANPDDISVDYANGLKSLGFNRVSLGVQSFSDQELSFLRRRHSSQQVYAAIEALRKASIDNISIDLIYALPNQTPEQWRRNVQSAIGLQVPHISSYHLICEEGTPLYKSVERNRIVLPKEEQGIEAYYYLVEELERNGFCHYEISNFALEGYISRHNSSYWQRIPYYGLGPSAHSYEPEKRWANVPDIASYTKIISTHQLPIGFEETLSPNDQYNERVMLGLRTQEGVNAQQLKNALGADFYNLLKERSQPYCEKGLLIWRGEYLQPTPQGFIFVDGIIRDIFSL